ncbi:MAG: hypothetical protein DBX55_03850 [Verrucomicrobia bacterium]|nr:MAG: hypothetical protein DBX55_03850 [Verrucomicrobiota bacterium]
MAACRVGERVGALFGRSRGSIAAFFSSLFRHFLRVFCALPFRMPLCAFARGSEKMSRKNRASDF